MARKKEDALVDYKAIAITVDGTVTSTSNARGSAADSADGFVYTVPTEKNEEGSYNYSYKKANSSVFEEINPLTHIVNGTDDANRDLDTFRKEKTFEGIVGYKQFEENNDYTGEVTQSSKFMYNEGNLGNQNSSPKTGELEKEYAGIDGNINFYDKNITKFSNQISKVRSLISE